MRVVDSCKATTGSKAEALVAAVLTLPTVEVTLAGAVVVVDAVIVVAVSLAM